MPVPTELSALDPCTAPEVLALLRHCPDIEPLRYRDAECLVTENEEDREIFLVLNGSLRVERSAENAQAPPKILATLACEPDHPGIVGEMAYFGAQRRTASVRSIGGSLVLKLLPRHLDEIFEHLPGLTRLLCRQFTQRLQESNETLMGFQRRFDLAPARRMAEPGERLFTAGDPPTNLYQLLMGTVDLERDGVVCQMAPHDLPEGFLEPEAFLGNRPHRSTATVSCAAFLVMISADRKENFLRSYPQVALKILEQPDRS
jgi:CRP-like cAMP-binding protein